MANSNINPREIFVEEFTATSNASAFITIPQHDGCICLGIMTTVNSGSDGIMLYGRRNNIVKYTDLNGNPKPNSSSNFLGVYCRL